MKKLVLLFLFICFSCAKEDSLSNVDSTFKAELNLSKTFGGSLEEKINGVVKTADGGIIIIGNTNSNDGDIIKTHSQIDIWVTKIDANGNKVWSKTIGGSQNDYGSSIIATSDGNYVIAGYSASNNEDVPGNVGLHDFFISKINEQGVIIWSRNYGFSGHDHAHKIIQTRDGGYLLTGTSNGKASKDKNNTIGGNDFWVMKLKDKTKPEKEKLPIEAFPNPALTFTNVIIGFDYTNGTANVYDLNGRQLQSHKLDGNRTLPIEMTSYPTGIYIVEIVTNKEKNSIKIIKK